MYEAVYIWLDIIICSDRDGNYDKPISIAEYFTPKHRLLDTTKEIAAFGVDDKVYRGRQYGESPTILQRTYQNSMGLTVSNVGPGVTIAPPSPLHRPDSAAPVAWSPGTTILLSSMFLSHLILCVFQLCLHDHIRPTFV